MGEFLDWYEENFKISVPDRENRLACLSESQGAFYRKKEPLKFDIFKASMKTDVNYYIRRALVGFLFRNFWKIFSRIFTKKTISTRVFWKAIWKKTLASFQKKKLRSTKSPTLLDQNIWWARSTKKSSCENWSTSARFIFITEAIPWFAKFFFSLC